ncbi:hypothetical protein ID866_5057 [Astraeus odoratus]|nr:hypothetical protein ID866_5057 [Astraeus odoratus]
MSVPAFSVHGTFSPAVSSYSRASHQLSSYASYAGVIIDNNHLLPDLRSRPRSIWHSAPVLLPLASPRRPAVNIPMSETTRRVPLAPRTSAAQPARFPPQDPFDDANVVPVPPITGLVPHARTRVASQSQSPITVKLPRAVPLDALVRQRTAQRAAAQDHEARLKAVAGILLTRGNSAGRCGRRAPVRRDVPRTYRRSGLSTMISVDDM